MGVSHTRWWFAGAILWGLAEATFFFVVPDLLLTGAVICLGLKAAFRLSAAAAGAAVLGGLIMWFWGSHGLNAAREFLLSVPLIGPDLTTRVAEEMTGLWPLNLTLGAITGAPFKIYAVEAGAYGVNPVLFAVVGFCARLARFSLAIGLTALGVALANRLGLSRLVLYGLAACWIMIYAYYLVVRLTV